MSLGTELSGGRPRLTHQGNGAIDADAENSTARGMAKSAAVTIAQQTLFKVTSLSFLVVWDASILR